MLDSINKIKLNKKMEKGRKNKKKEKIKDEPVLTGYLACDQDGKVFLYVTKPHKSKVVSVSPLGLWQVDDLSEYMYVPSDKLPKGINPKWEDDEPLEVEISIKLKQK